MMIPEGEEIDLGLDFGGEAMNDQNEFDIAGGMAPEDEYVNARRALENTHSTDWLAYGLSRVLVATSFGVAFVLAAFTARSVYPHWAQTCPSNRVASRTYVPCKLT